jgi:Ser/Thr protein kinase RdoA (MazF antagonist)
MWRGAAMGEGDDASLARLSEMARDALRHYDIRADAELTLLNVSENATYRVDAPGSEQPTVLRIHRPGYHTRAAIESELDWVKSLREDAVVRTAHVVHASGGARVVDARHPDGERRAAVMFEWMPGTEPPDDRLVEDFTELGSITARLHRHARGWQRPAGFTRFRWDFDTSIGDHGHWGAWRDGLGMSPDQRVQLGRLAERLRERLARFGTGPDRFGLIHADMRLANLLVDGSQVAVIDFDDCGLGWYMYDLGSSLSFIEADPRVPELIDSWVRGYRREAPLSAEDERELPTFVLLRRLLLVAWIGSHSDTELAREMGVEYTRVSCDLAEEYLSRFPPAAGGS